MGALLADLRRGYRGLPWRWRGTRTTYPVVLLDGVSAANGGYRLLSLVNEVRNDTGRFDPLLIVATAALPPPGLPGTDGRVVPCVQARRGYQDWLRRLPAARRSPEGKPTAWYLPIHVPPQVSGQPPDPDAGHIEPASPLTSPGPRLLWSRTVPVAVVAVALAAGGLGYWHWSDKHCGQYFPVHSEVLREGAECVGISTGEYHFQGSDAQLADVQETAHRQNLDAERQHHQSPGRPYVTLAYVAALTVRSRPPHDDPVSVAEREELEGILTAQRLALQRISDTAPLVRILVVNAGEQMAHGPEVAAMLAERARSDPSFVGVVGLDQSRQNTIETIKRLSRSGIPVVAATLSADTLTSISPLYYQVAPQNTREAAIAASYAKQLLARGEISKAKIRVLFSGDPNDVYSQNLNQDMRVWGEHFGFRYEPWPFSPGNQALHGLPGPREAGQDACEYPGLIYYAGRPEDFRDFLSGIDQTCGERPPTILGDDDITRYVADPTLRSQYRSITFYYESFAVGPTSCNKSDVAAVASNVQTFHQALTDLFGFECDPATGRALDGHAALAYDATNTLLHAAEDLRTQEQQIPITPAAVWRELASIHGQHAHLDGASGIIDFGGDVARQVPFDKPIAILRVADGQPHLEGFCGASATARSDAWCPPPS